jgi:transcriptional regulator with XRE-family HTH domain
VENGSRTIEEWEALIGEHVRNVRIASDLDQQRLSELANVSVGAVSNLERGKGSSLKTLVAVVRAVERTDWLESLAPPITVSPIQMLRAKQRSPRTRVRVRGAGASKRRR